jgi:hypothetical protein
MRSSSSLIRSHENRSFFAVVRSIRDGNSARFNRIRLRMWMMAGIEVSRTKGRRPGAESPISAESTK